MSKICIFIWYAISWNITFLLHVLKIGTFIIIRNQFLYLIIIKWSHLWKQSLWKLSWRKPILQVTISFLLLWILEHSFFSLTLENNIYWSVSAKIQPTKLHSCLKKTISVIFWVDIVIFNLCFLSDSMYPHSRRYFNSGILLVIKA